MKYQIQPPNRLSQVRLAPATNDERQPDARYSEEYKVLQASILRLCGAHLWPKGSHENACPRPVLVAPEHQEQLSRLHDALALAIGDIVERWWTDSEARFPQRMPVSAQEEELLQWLETQDIPYQNRQGSWRPDFLVEEGSKLAQGVENFRITEINGRFSFNGFMHEAYGQAALEGLGVERNGFVHGTDPSKLLTGLLSLFRPNLPLHLLKGVEAGIDIHMVIDFVHRYLGIKPRLISPADLRLIPAPNEKGGYKVCCLTNGRSSNAVGASSPAVLTTPDGEEVEEIHQIGLELHQHELMDLDPEMLRQISLRCFNDMRTILLVHDKRMLGIIKQEIPSLVAREVLTPAQGESLQRGIADTFLPGSPELDELIALCTGNDNGADLRKGYLLKPIRGGKGAGILFGDELTPSQWQEKLQRLHNPLLVPGVPSYVVQRLVRPRLYDMTLRVSEKPGQYPLVGTYHSVHGRFLGLGIWRSSPDRICAVSTGGAWACSVMHQ